MFQAVSHVGMRVQDWGAAREFYVGVLGLVPHPEKSNWLGWAGAAGWPVHLMPAGDSAAGQDEADLARHLALEVESLEAIVAVLLAAKLQPFLASLQNERRFITSAGDDLSFGLGTVFVQDPDGNMIEFVEAGRGIVGQYR